MQILILRLTSRNPGHFEELGRRLRVISWTPMWSTLIFKEKSIYVVRLVIIKKSCSLLHSISWGLCGHSFLGVADTLASQLLLLVATPPGALRSQVINYNNGPTIGGEVLHCANSPKERTRQIKSSLHRDIFILSQQPYRGWGVLMIIIKKRDTSKQGSWRRNTF